MQRGLALSYSSHLASVNFVAEIWPKEGGASHDREQNSNILWYCTDAQRYDTIGALGNSRIARRISTGWPPVVSLSSELIRKVRFARQTARAF